jgi:hypothetical protein
MFLTVDAEGRVLVSINSPEALLCFTADGVCDREIGPLPEAGDGGGACALRDGSIAVASRGAATVTIFPPDLADPTTIPVGDADVWSVAETPEGHLLLASWEAGGVWVSNRAGQKLRSLVGSDASLQYQPAVSAEGAVLVADSGAEALLLFEGGGARSKLASQQHGVASVAVLPSGAVAASTREDGCIHFFRVRAQ